MKKKVIIFGITEMSDFIRYYIERFTDYEVFAYCVDGKYKTNDYYKDKYVIITDDLVNYNPEDYSFYIAIGPTNMNKSREKVFENIKSLNYKCINIIHPTVVCDGKIGENNFIGAYSIINHDVSIGSNNIIYENCIVSTRGKVQDHCYLAPKAYVGSDSVIMNNSILGINSTVKNGVLVEEESFIGACCFISCNTKKKSVYGVRQSEFLGCVSNKINISMI